MTYCRVVDYLLAIYATDDVSSKAEADLTNSKRPEEKYAARYSKVLREKELCCGRVYDDLRINELFIKRLPQIH